MDELPPPPRPPRSRWTSFIAERGKTKSRTLHEEGNPDHRLRVEHKQHMSLVQLSDEDGHGWTAAPVRGFSPTIRPADPAAASAVPPPLLAGTRAMAGG